jgi:hypothetical protein
MGGHLRSPPAPTIISRPPNLFQRIVQALLGNRLAHSVLPGFTRALYLYIFYWLTRFSLLTLETWIVDHPVIVTVGSLLVSFLLLFLSINRPESIRRAALWLKDYILASPAGPGYVVVAIIWTLLSVIDVLPPHPPLNSHVHWFWLAVSILLSCSISFFLAWRLFNDDNTNGNSPSGGGGSSGGGPDDGGLRRLEERLEERIRAADARELRLNAEQQSLRRQQDSLNLVLLQRDNEHREALHNQRTRSELHHRQDRLEYTRDSDFEIWTLREESQILREDHRKRLMAVKHFESRSIRLAAALEESNAAHDRLQRDFASMTTNFEAYNTWMQAVLDADQTPPSLLPAQQALLILARQQTVLGRGIASVEETQAALQQREDDLFEREQNLLLREDACLIREQEYQDLSSGSSDTIDSSPPAGSSPGRIFCPMVTDKFM